MSHKIVYQTENGGVAIVHPTGEVAIERLVVSGIIPGGAPWEIVDSDNILPTDRIFRDAWKVTGIGSTEQTVILEDTTSMKEIAHEMRRKVRQEEFEPYDNIIMKQIPGEDAVSAEAARAEIRTRYVGIQSSIDEAADPLAIRSALTDRGII